MSRSLHFTGPFFKDFHQLYQSGTAFPVGSSFLAFQRHAGNPSGNTLTNDYVKSPLRRVYLLIQNLGTSSVEFCLNDNGSGNPSTYPTITLMPNQTMAFENYNGPISATAGTIKIIEAYA
jgi:hypothetical protein